jgi:hypothetical protein
MHGASFLVCSGCGDARQCMSVCRSHLACSARGDLLAPGLGGFDQCGFVEARQETGVEQLFTADPDVFHAMAAAGIDQLRNRIIDGLLSQAAQVECHQVGSLAEFQ